MLKEIVTKRIGYSIWQRGYHDHIIRNAADYRRVWDYIDTNPADGGKTATTQEPRSDHGKKRGKNQCDAPAGPEEDPLRPPHLSPRRGRGPRRGERGKQPGH